MEGVATFQRLICITFHNNYFWGPDLERLDPPCSIVSAGQEARAESMRRSKYPINEGSNSVSTAAAITPSTTPVIAESASTGSTNPQSPASATPPTTNAESAKNTTEQTGVKEGKTTPTPKSEGGGVASTNGSGGPSGESGSGLAEKTQTTNSSTSTGEVNSA